MAWNPDGYVYNKAGTALTGLTVNAYRIDTGALAGTTTTVAAAGAKGAGYWVITGLLDTLEYRIEIIYSATQKLVRTRFSAEMGTLVVVDKAFLPTLTYQNGTLISSTYAPIASPTFTGTATIPTATITNLTASTSAALPAGSVTTVGGVTLDARYVNTAGDTMTGALLIAAGSVGAPGLSIAGSGSGLYQIGANQIGIAISGVMVADINATNFTISPTAILNVGAEVGNSSTGSGRLDFHNASGHSDYDVRLSVAGGTSGGAGGGTLTNTGSFAVTGATTLTGAVTLASYALLENTGPSIYMKNTGAASGSRSWQLTTTGEILYFQAVNDALSSGGGVVFSIFRSGTEVSGVQIGAQGAIFNGNIFDVVGRASFADTGIQIGRSGTAADNFHLVSDASGGNRALRIYGGNYGTGTLRMAIGTEVSITGGDASLAALRVREATGGTSSHYVLRVESDGGSVFFGIMGNGALRMSGIDSSLVATPGTVQKKLEIFDTSGASQGYIPIYTGI